VQGVLGFGDQIKDGAVEMVQRLRARGLIVKMVTGDAWPTPQWLLAKSALTTSRPKPHPPTRRASSKSCNNQESEWPLSRRVNDAPALAQADLGIAMGTGADIAMGAAPVVLVSGTLARLEDAFRLAEKTTRVVRQNLFWAFFYNAIGIALALTEL